MKKMKYWIDLILTAYEGLCVGFVSAIIICLFIFGGEVTIQINWHSAIDLLNAIFKKK